MTDSTSSASGEIEIREGELDHEALGFTDALVIGLASTAPAYSLAAVIGSVVVIVGVNAPGALLASFVPMFLIATAFFYMNRADPDAGTTFSWVTRAMGPWAGWMAGWAIATTGILVVGSLADVGARYAYLLVGWDTAAGSKPAVVALAVVIIVVMTAICILGTELSAHVQNWMIIGQVAALLLFAGVALWKVGAGDALDGSLDPQLSWLSPFGIGDFSALVSSLLIGVFIYWGWESAVNLTEETRDSRRAPGLAAIVSTLVLLVTYLAVSISVIAYAGLDTLAEFDDDEGIFSFLAGDVLGSPLDKLVVLAIVTSAIASTQTTIIPASRSTMSMARQGAFPRRFAHIHPRFQTPSFSTAVIAVAAIAWYVPSVFVSENFLFDTLSALSLMIAFYYALSGFACAIYHRRELAKSLKNLVFMGIAPVAGGAMLTFLFFRSAIDLADPGASYTGGDVLGVGTPLAIAIAFFVLGLVLLVAWRLAGDHEAFFARKGLEVVDPDVASGVKAVSGEGA